MLTTDELARLREIRSDMLAAAHSIESIWIRAAPITEALKLVRLGFSLVQASQDLRNAVSAYFELTRRAIERSRGEI